MGGVRLELMPSLVAYGALSLATARYRFGYAMLAGLIQDSFSASAPYGFSALSYGIAALILIRGERFLDRDLPWVQAGAAFLVAFVNGVIAILSSGWFSAGTIPKLALLGLLSAFLAPWLFAGIDYLAREMRRESI